MTEVPKPLDAALDLFLYAPVGLAVTAAEELPKLAAKGRTRVNTQLMMARVVGQFAVSRGRQELEKRFAPPAPPTRPPAVEPEPEPPVTFDQMTANGAAAGSSNGRGPAARTETTEGGDQLSVTVAGDLQAVAGTEPAVAGPGVEGSAGAGPAEGPVPAAGDLAIPGYDSLSASQVVQRLAGLDGDELRAVASYERAHRGRRTILNRIDQLRGQ